MAELNPAASMLPRETFRSLDRGVLDPLLDALEKDALAQSQSALFYARMLEQLATISVGSLGAWHVDEGNTATIAWWGESNPSSDLSVPSPLDAQTIQSVVATYKPQRIELAGTCTSKTSAHFIYLAPWRSPLGTQGVVGLAFQSHSYELSLTDCLPLLAALSEIVATFEGRMQQQRLEHRLESKVKLTTFVERIHRSLEVRQTAYTIANEGRVLVDCDRMSVVIRDGKKYRAAAISGAEHIHRHSPSADELNLLSERIAATGESFWFNAVQEHHAPQISEALGAYLDQSPAAALAVLPLVAEPSQESPRRPPIGLLVFENYQAPFSDDVKEAMRSMIDPARNALQNAVSVNSIPGHRVWMSLGANQWVSRWGIRFLMATLAITFLVALLLLVPADIRARAHGELQPTVRREVFAPRDGVVTEIYVEHGDTVQSQQPLLELRSSELDLERQRVDGELDTMRKKLAAIQSERLQIRSGESDARVRERRLTAEEDQLLQQVTALESRQSMLKKQAEELIVRSPIKGQVLTWNATEKLVTRPLARGDALLTVADVDSEWEIEVQVPSRQIGRFLEARRDGGSEQRVSVMLTTDPGESFPGTISHVSSRTRKDAAGDVYLDIRVAVPREAIRYKTAGSAAIVRIDCGRGSLGEAWFHELFDAIRIWFPL